jgi:predicted Rossmann-fold nucleotide-binding protein
MASASQAFCHIKRRRSLCIGILPAEAGDDGRYAVIKGYPNAWVELSIVAPLTIYMGGGEGEINRNHVNVLASDIIVALPGGTGTLNEAALAVRFGKPIILFGPIERFADFPSSSSENCPS